MRLKANEEDLNVNLVRAILYRLSSLSRSTFAIDTQMEKVDRRHLLIRCLKQASFMQEIVRAIRNNGIFVGEMTSEDMEQSMMNEELRRLEVLTIRDVESVKNKIEMLMGQEVKERRDFLFDRVDFNKLNY